jgi:nitronate monooxygenase
VNAHERDIVLTDKISGVPVAVIKTPYIEKIGTRAGFIARRMLRHPRFKHWVRTYYSLRALWQLKRANLHGMSYKDYFQAGKSVEDITEVISAREVVRLFAAALEQEPADQPGEEEPIATRGRPLE